MSSPTPPPLGLCCYALAWSCGFAGDGTPRACPEPLDAGGLLDLALSHGLGRLELPRSMVPDDASRAAFRERAGAAGVALTLAGRRVGPELWLDAECAQAIGARILRCTLSGILCGDRTALGLAGWQELLANAAVTLRELLPRLEEWDLRVAVENHQDATSADLLWLCETVGSDRVGVTLDTANPLAVAEEPLTFARRVLPHLVNVHLKDYWVFPTPQGYRLVHCPTGAGVIDFAALFELLRDRPGVARSIELPALEARHVRFLDDDWWTAHDARAAYEILPVLRLREAQASSGEWRTPWELGDEQRLGGWERARLAESVQRLRALGA